VGYEDLQKIAILHGREQQRPVGEDLPGVGHGGSFPLFEEIPNKAG
jgi:hypothetical protein